MKKAAEAIKYIKNKFLHVTSLILRPSLQVLKEWDVISTTAPACF